MVQICLPAPPNRESCERPNRCEGSCHWSEARDGLAHVVKQRCLGVRLSETRTNRNLVGVSLIGRCLGEEERSQTGLEVCRNLRLFSR